uniref:Uncharacterized protein n=1 Tax=Anguilla anguilla TaxID=7936 RepID=A0A0E9PCB8_ANGAN
MTCLLTMRQLLLSTAWTGQHYFLLDHFKPQQLAGATERPLITPIISNKRLLLTAPQRYQPGAEG